MVKNMRYNLEEMKEIEAVQGDMLKELDYHLETIPGVSVVTASGLVGNIGDIKRFKSADRLSNFAGIAPLYSGSAGKGKTITINYLETANYMIFAIQQVQKDRKGELRNPEMRAYFEYKVSKGKTKIQALICIMRRLVRIVYAMMKYQTCYKMPQISTDTAEFDCDINQEMVI